MIRNILALAACLGLTACASNGHHAEQWTKADTRREIAFQLVNALDALQTDQIRARDDLVEVGPIARAAMGPEPSRSDVAVYFATRAVTHYFISRAIPSSWRRYWQYATVANQGYVVVRNCTKYELRC